MANGLSNPWQGRDFSGYEFSGIPFAIIGQKLFQANICQGMLEQAGNDTQRTGNHIRSDLRTLDQVHIMADGGRKDFRIKVIVLINEGDLLNQFQTIKGDVVQPANKGRHIGSSCLGREKWPDPH